MTTYWSILEKVPGSKLRLTKIDDEINEHFLKEFPDYDLKARINEDEMKSKAGKERWRSFINTYENKIDDYNFGTMLRSSPAEEYSQEETIFGGLRCEDTCCCCEALTFYSLSRPHAILRYRDCEVCFWTCCSSRIELLLTRI